MRVSVRRSLVLLAALFALATGTAQSAVPSRAATARGEILGRLVAPDVQPVTGGSIAVRHGTETPSPVALLRSDGTFLVDGLTLGTYTVRIPLSTLLSPPSSHSRS
jgi:hypothetical protein